MSNTYNILDAAVVLADPDESESPGVASQLQRLTADDLKEHLSKQAAVAMLLYNAPGRRDRFRAMRATLVEKDSGLWAEIPGVGEVLLATPSGTADVSSRSRLAASPDT